jgi:hypothetical protein
MANKQCKPTFVKHMLKQEEKRGKQFNDDEKIFAWRLWQHCWNDVRKQLRDEMKAIAKQERKRNENKTV